MWGGDKAVFGVIVFKSLFPKTTGIKLKRVSVSGWSMPWVKDASGGTYINGEIRAGGYITTSSLPGYDQMQDDDILHSYTLGKAIETVDFDQVGATISHNGKMYKAYLLAVVYTSGYVE